MVTMTDETYITSLTGWGKSPFADIGDDDNYISSRNRTIRKDGSEVLKEDLDRLVEDVVVIDGEFISAWIDGKEETAKEGLHIELDGDGNVKAMTFEFGGGFTEEPADPWVDIAYEAWRARFQAEPQWELDRIEDARLKAEDEAAGVKPDRKPYLSRKAKVKVEVGSKYYKFKYYHVYKTKAGVKKTYRVR